ncbi:MAG TPA: hypothetical protein VMS63_07900 [Gaiellaceae bacterium]|nr:hypothetical protein [Gaiellaceae bacterium]
MLATELAEWAEGLVLKGLRAFGQRWTVSVEGGAVTVEPAEG